MMKTKHTDKTLAWVRKITRRVLEIARTGEPLIPLSMSRIEWAQREQRLAKRRGAARRSNTVDAHGTQKEASHG